MKLMQQGAVVTPYCQEQLIEARYGGRDFRVFGFDLLPDLVSGEIQARIR